METAIEASYNNNSSEQHIKMHNKCQIKQHKIIKVVTATPEVTKNYKKDAWN